jgi:hypothetical protein
MVNYRIRISVGEDLYDFVDRSNVTFMVIQLLGVKGTNHFGTHFAKPLLF